MKYTEDTLVHQTTAEYLKKQLDWKSVHAYNNEDFGPVSLNGCLVRYAECFIAGFPPARE